jgi:hypothetical protein
MSNGYPAILQPEPGDLFSDARVIEKLNILFEENTREDILPQ